MSGSLTSLGYLASTVITDGTATVSSGTPKGLVSIGFSTSVIDGSTSGTVATVDTGAVYITDSPNTTNPPVIDMSFTVAMTHGQMFHVSNHHHGVAALFVSFNTPNDVSTVTTPINVLSKTQVTLMFDETTNQLDYFLTAPAHDCIAATTCSGNGICQTDGSCECDDGWAGANCSCDVTTW